MLRDGQSKAMENMTKANPMASMPGFEAMRAQQEAFFKAMTGSMMGNAPTSQPEKAEGEDLSEIKDQLAALQEKLSKLGK
jgi:polyhydroxyalkanoate synthesis regulator protein